MLEEISRQFVQRAVSLQIMSFYETKVERHLPCLVTITSCLSPRWLNEMIMIMLRIQAYKMCLIRLYLSRQLS